MLRSCVLTFTALVLGLTGVAHSTDRVMTARLAPAPLPGSAVAVQGWSYPAEGHPEPIELTTTSAAGGLLEFRLPNSSAVDLRLLVEDWAPVYLWDVRSGVEDLGEIQLSTGGSINGTVHDADTQKAVGGAMVRLWSQVSSPSDRDRRIRMASATGVDTGGFFQFDGVPAGRWELEVFTGDQALMDLPGARDQLEQTLAWTRAWMGPPVEAVEVADGAETRVDLSVYRGAMLTVGLRPPPPTPGAWSLRLSRVDGNGASAYLPVDDQGLAPIPELKPGIYWIKVIDRTGRRDSVGRDSVLWSEKLVVPAPASFLPVDVPVVQLRARVLAGSAPLVGTEVELETVAGESMYFIADEDGKLSGVARRPERRGALSATVYSADPSFRRRLRIHDYRLSDDAIEFEIRFSAGEISGLVVAPSGEPAPDTRVIVESAGLGAIDYQDATTDVDGQFAISELLPGRYTVRAEGEAGFSAATPVELSESSPAPLRLELVAPRRVSGRVVGTDGAGLSGAWLTTTVTSPAIVVKGQAAGPDGSFELTVPEGAARVAVQVFTIAAGFWATCVAVPGEGETWQLSLPPTGELVLKIGPAEWLPPASAGLLYLATSSGGLLRVSGLSHWRRLLGEGSEERVDGRFANIASDSYAVGYHLGPWWSLVDQVCTTGRGAPSKGWEILAEGGRAILSYDLRPAQRAEAGQRGLNP